MGLLSSPQNVFTGGAVGGPLGQALGAGYSGDLFGLSMQDVFGGGTQSSTSASGPWGPQQQYLKDLYSKAQGLYGNQSPYTSQAMNLRAQRAMEGSPLNVGAQQGLLDTMSGAYMPGGSKYQDISGALMNQIMPAVDTRFARSGRFGGGLHKAELGSQLTDKLLANTNFERANMMRAMGMAPQQAMQDYMDINQLAQAGQVPWQQLFNYQQALGPTVMQSRGQSQGQQTGGIIPGLGGLFSMSVPI